MFTACHIWTVSYVYKITAVQGHATSLLVRDYWERVCK